jgi:hypothetical protein
MGESRGGLLLWVAVMGFQERRREAQNRRCCLVDPP